MIKDQKIIKPVMSKYLLFILITCSTLFVFVLTAEANIKLPALIGDNMILQQQSEITLWGWADKGEQISIKPSWLKKEIRTTTDSDGKWQIKVKTTKAGGPYTISFSGNNRIEVKDVLLGEVWLASGQSNMEFYMDKGEGWRTGVINYQEEIAKANNPDIRMIDVPNTVADTPRDNFDGQWEVCTPATTGKFSAVAYYFAVKVQQETGFPVGIINATWGGTPAESWTRKEVLEKDFKSILDRYQKVCDDYPEAFKKYQVKLDQWKADTSSKKKGAPKEPLGPKHNKSPYKLYNGMIAPLLSYKLKGVIWYQGESNATYAWQYRRLFPAMINDWRQQFKHNDLPFYFVQIAPHNGQNPVIREAQLYTFKNVSNTGIVVTTDVGDAKDIHPRNKRTVGERLARWALHNQYGNKKLETSGPLYKSMRIEGNKIILHFDHAEGLSFQGETSKEFMIAAKDEKFVSAQAIIRGNTIEVWSDEIKEPVAVRFAWKNVPEPNLFNQSGLPASPFRTDNWSVETQDKN
jgi:sialate O-acetylesterase